MLHTIAERHKDLLWYVGLVVRVYDRLALIEAEDCHEKWSSRQQEIRLAMKAGRKDYQRYTQWAETLAFLFPEMAQQFAVIAVEQADAQYERGEATAD